MIIMIIIIILIMIVIMIILLLIIIIIIIIIISIRPGGLQVHEGSVQQRPEEPQAGVVAQLRQRVHHLARRTNRCFL